MSVSGRHVRSVRAGLAPRTRVVGGTAGSAGLAPALALEGMEGGRRSSLTAGHRLPEEERPRRGLSSPAEGGLVPVPGGHSGQLFPEAAL